MNKIIIFKTDRIGDFINFSPCLKIIKHNFKESEITVVCSKYNYQIVKNYEEIDKIVVLRTTIILDFFTILKSFFPNKYDYLFQLDGNKRSYFLSCFISANIKSTIFFFKDLNIFNFKYKKIRPNFIIRSFYKNYILCNEDYDNFEDETHYQKIYFQLLKNINYEINHKQNVFYLEQKFKKGFNLILENLSDDYYLFHIDDKSNRLNLNQFNALINTIHKIGKKYNLILTLGISNIKYEKLLRENFIIHDYKDFKTNPRVAKNRSILAIRNLPLNLLAYFIANAQANISMHSGLIVHISAAFNKLIIDVIETHKNNEIDRWIPVISEYRRVDLDQLNEFEI